MRRMACLFVLLCLTQPALAQEETTDSSKTSSGGHWGISGAAGFGSNSFGLRLTILYFFNDFVGVQTSGHYTQSAGSSYKAVNYGPEAAGILQLTNPTPITPYIGAGMGYEMWERTEDDEVFDDSSSPTAVYFAGLGIGLGSQLRLNLQNTWTTFLSDPPRQFGDHQAYEGATISSFGLGISILL